jgi:hypothetical protein
MFEYVYGFYVVYGCLENPKRHATKHFRDLSGQKPSKFHGVPFGDKSSVSFSLIIHGESMDYPWIIQGLSMDNPLINPWTLNGLPIDNPWIIHDLDNPWLIHG